MASSINSIETGATQFINYVGMNFPGRETFFERTFAPLVAYGGYAKGLFYILGQISRFGNGNATLGNTFSHLTYGAIYLSPLLGRLFKEDGSDSNALRLLAFGTQIVDIFFYVGRVSYLFTAIKSINILLGPALEWWDTRRRYESNN